MRNSRDAILSRIIFYSTFLYILLFHSSVHMFEPKKVYVRLEVKGVNALSILIMYWRP